MRPCLLFLAVQALLPAAALLAATPAPSQKPTASLTSPAYTLEQALTLRSCSALTWSGDGRRLAFVVSEVDTTENANNQDVWLWEAGADTARRLTRSPKNDWSPTFSPSGDTIAFVSARATGDDPRSGIYLMSLAGGEPWAFGSYDESVGEVAWSPDGRWLAYVRPDTLPKQVREWRKKKWDQEVEDERLQYPQLWVVEVRTGRHRRLTSGAQWIWNARWSPDSRSIAFLVSPTGKPDDGNLTDVGIVPVMGGPVRTLGVIGNGSFAWSPDGRWIALATTADRAKYVEKADLWVVPAAGGRPVNLTARFPEDAEAPAWSPGSDTLFFHVAQGELTVLAAAPLHGGAVSLRKVIQGDAGPPVAARAGRVAWTQSFPQTPTEVWAADHPELEGRPVTRVNAAVHGARLGVSRGVSWTSSDGVQVGGVLMRPPGVPESTPLKTLVLLHGGPYASRFSLGFEPVPQFYAAHGYQVFMPNFRSSGGYGTAFMLRQRADWGGQDWRDVDTGVDELVRKKLADGDRLGVFGHSYGGYLTAWAITHTPRYDAAVVSAGAPDLPALWAQSDTHQYRAFEFEGLPWTSFDKWRRSSPIAFIDHAKTPTLVLNGEADVRIPYPQAQETYQSLKFLGVPTEFVHYPREGHGLREPRHRADWYVRQAAWFDRWVK